MKIILTEQIIGERVQTEYHPIPIEMLRVIVILLLFFLCNQQTSLAQTVSPGSMKVYITWIRIKAEKEKKSRLNFNINETAILSPGKYKITDDLGSRLGFLKTDAGNISLVRVRNSPGSGKDVPPDDFTFDLYPGTNGNNTGCMNQGSFLDGAQDLQAAAIDGIAGVAVVILQSALASANVNNPEIHISKAHVRKKEQQALMNNENRNSLSGNRLQGNKNPAGFIFTPLRDSVKDIDGNAYSTAALGAMVIMAENLRVMHFLNGKEISCLKDTSDMRAVNIPACCNYRSDSGISAAKGMLYNWRAVSDTSRICPKNWHIPSSSEWTSLISCLGGTGKAAGKLMESFPFEGKVSNWWSSTAQDTSHAYSFYLDPGAMEVKLTVTARNSGLAVRCIRDY